MSVRWITWAWEQDVPPTTKLTLIALCDHAGEDGIAWPSSGRLAEKTGQNNRTVRRHLDDLEARGLLVRERHRRADGTLGTYTIHLQPADTSGHWSDPTTGRRTTSTSGQIEPQPADIAMSAQNRHIEPSVEPSVSSAWPTFDDFWSFYAKKKGKGEARLRWAKLSKADQRDAIEGARRHGQMIADNPGVFVLPEGPVWLNKRRWEEDEPRRPPNTAKPGIMDRVKAKREAQRPHLTVIDTEAR